MEYSGMITILVFFSEYEVDNDDNSSDDGAWNEIVITKHSIKFLHYISV